MTDERTLHSILIVDDDTTLLNAAKRSLGGAWRVLTAGDIAGARAICARERLHVAVVDLHLRFESGLDLLREFKRDYPEVRTVLLTGYLTHQVTAEAVLAGVRVMAEKLVGERPTSLKRVALLAQTTEDRIVVIAEEPHDNNHQRTLLALLDASQDLSLERWMSEFARAALAQYRGNIVRTAAALGIGRTRLYRLLGRSPRTRD